MRLLAFSYIRSADNLALEEAIQLGLEDGTSPPTWRVWEAAAPAIVLGTGQEHAKEVDMDAARAAGVPVLRRHSGGGAVLIGPGVINYSGFFIIKDLPGAETITGAMQAGLQPVLVALKTLGVQARFAGLSDLVVESREGERDARKLAGNAQARKRVSVLVHGTLLADPDWALMERLLKFPSRAPDYRAGRGHRAFLTSLKDLGAPSDLASFAAALRKQLKEPVQDAAGPSAAEAARAKQLFAEKYSQPEWNLRR
ncbi:MAG: lipoate--protein ligase family protein [Planctomycetes bacterium]|nr:lipoate--protein ligase family protein [Planctomycetota bacterium]